MKNYATLIEAFHAAPWAITAEKFHEIRGFLLVKAAGKKVSKKQINAAVSGRREVALGALAGVRREGGVMMVGRVAVLSVFGTISQRVSMLGEASGGVSAERIGASLDSLVADKSVKSVVMAFDSPGGSVYGIPELAAKIRAARDQKKIVGMADSVAASAALWLICQCSEINITPGGQMGSLGVFSSHVDVSEAEKQLGVKTTLVASTPFKVESSPYAPLSEEAQGEMQTKVNAYHAMFVADVAKGRGLTTSKVESDFGQGRMLTAKEAVAKGMADHVATMEQVLRRQGADVAGSGAAAAGEGAPLSARLASARARAVEVGLRA
jgi:signal peptide peptidase SppA